MRGIRSNAQYASAACDMCGIILPKYEMRQVSVRQRAGESQRAWTSFGRSRSTRLGHGTRYVQRRLLICPDCRPPRAEGGTLRTVTRLVLGVTLFGGIAIMVVSAISSGLGTVESPMLDPPLAPAATGVDVPNAEMEKLPKLPDPLPAPSPEPFQFQLPEIIDAKIKAATTGKAIRWRAGGNEGYAVPSAISVSSATGVQCRNVYATLDGSAEQSLTERYCQAPTGTWAEG